MLMKKFVLVYTRSNWVQYSFGNRLVTEDVTGEFRIEDMIGFQAPGPRRKLPVFFFFFFQFLALKHLRLALIQR